MPFTLRSEAFVSNESLNSRFTCEGDDVSPPLDWVEPPAGTKSYALIVDDPDAPDPQAPKRVFVHWVLYNITASATSLPEGVKPEALPPGTRLGLNDWKKTGYGGPCPPVGRPRYFHKLYALDVMLPDLGTATKAELEKAMAGHVLAQDELIGTYHMRGLR